ncbi:60Kd inner membrane protein-domain-containing protein [Hysterangium stoloniferum]|nr:60Kd inner membrane protein-domain-containing protein [Hysterangium stoloniferum]
MLRSYCVISRKSLRLTPRRTFYTETLQTLSNVYLDLSIALPYPLGCPIYSSTIVLIGVVSRLALLPVSLWARQRERRLEENVVPYLKAFRAKLDDRVRQELLKGDSPQSREFYSRAASKKAREYIIQPLDSLFKEHRCTPWITMVVPPITQIPVFVVLSATFLQLANAPGTVLRDEAVLTLQSLAHPDPTVALPVILGLISLATVETSQWFVTQEKVRRLRETRLRNEAQLSQGKSIIDPRRHIKGIMSGLSVGRIILAATMPGSVVIYWLTSASCGLLANWVVNYSDRLKRAVPKTNSATVSAVKAKKANPMK